MQQWMLIMVVDRTARFENQFVSGPMSQGGDSGSLLVSGDSQKAVGLLICWIKSVNHFQSYPGRS